MTSCIAKLCEKMILNRINKFLKDNKIIIVQQSGFRKHRQTKDNILFLLQKIQESFKRKKKVLSFFFDISQAFDKVWHAGIIFKVINLNFPLYIIKWLHFYLEDRIFCIKVDSYTSIFRKITCGVPQGAVLSPTLFSIYINDIPCMFDKNKAFSLLFADDLVTSFIYKKNGNMEPKVNKYLKLLELWLNKWRLSMQSRKCNFMVFNNNSDKSIGKNLKFKLYDEFIPNCEHLKFLGITFDIGLVFNYHIKEIKKKCINRLNVIKILSNKSKKLTTKTLTTIYLSLIRSIIDYSSILLPSLSNSLTKTIQVIQNTAMKCIFKLNYLTSTEEVTRISGLPSISERTKLLNERYLTNCIKFGNPLIIDLIKQYKDGSKNFANKTFLCSFKEQTKLI
jgi:hypothetical protein